MLRATLRSFLAHRGRMLLSALAVLLSVAFVAGSLIFSDTVSRTFDRLFESSAADVSVEPRQEFTEAQGIYGGLIPVVPAALRADVAGVPGVAAAHLDVEVRNITLVDRRGEAVGPTTGPPTMAVNWQRTGHSVVELAGGREPRGPGEILLDRDTADRKDVAIGDTLRVIAAPGSFEARVVGFAAFTTTNPGATLIFMETPAAQEKLIGRPDAVTSVSLDAAPGVSDDELKQRVAAAVGPRFSVKTADEQAKTATEELGGFLDIIKYVMVGFAGIAVLVGIFLIVNTFSMLIAQRTRELGLLRALGADRRQVQRSVLTEALLLGLTGSTLGLVAGVGLAAGLIRLMGLLGMNLDAAEMVVGWTTPLAAYVVGLGVTFLAACLPARRAARVSPMAALADAEVAGVGRPLRLRAVAGAVVAAGGAAALVACARNGDTSTASLWLVLGIVLTLIATVIAGPLLVRPVIRVLGGAFPRVFGSVGAMSQRNALRNPRRTGATASALMVGLALVGGMSIAGASMTKSVDNEIDRSLGADFVVGGSSFGPFPREITDRVRDVPGVGLTVRQRYATARLTLPDGERVRTPLGAYDPELDKVFKLEYAAGDTAAALAPGHVGLQKEYADKHGIRVGSVLPVQFADGRRARLTVGALSSQESESFNAGGGFYLGIGTLERYQPGGQDSAVMLNAADGTGTEGLRSRLETALETYPQVAVRDQADFKDLVRQQISVLLYLVYALLGLAIVIAVLGVVNTLALSVVERTREIGLLRAIGLSRRQLRRMIRLESVVIAVFGAVLGLGLGLVWGVALWRVLALEGLRAFAVPWGTVLAVVLGSVVVGLAAALLPALRAARLNVLAAIAHE
ncbi:ABC transporter permease [Streptomyces smaragdinus]|uniref:ABC transporter permease n=1 Tax=Streptomyces smaragdinus TaxID=2585196 RepID=UPI002B206B66|nr:ABC transporter permease [Streptomyces smaragdinus]